MLKGICGLFGVVYQKLLEGYDKSKCSIVYYNDDTLDKARRQQVWPWFVIVERKVIKME